MNIALVTLIKMKANEYYNKIEQITLLGTIRKTLTPEALEYLKEKISEKIEQSETNDIEKILPFIVLFVYNEAYNCAINDVMDILRKKE